MWPIYDLFFFFVLFWTGYKPWVQSITWRDPTKLWEPAFFTIYSFGNLRDEKGRTWGWHHCNTGSGLVQIFSKSRIGSSGIITHHNIVDMSLDLVVRHARYFLSRWHWASYWIWLSLTFPFYKIEINRTYLVVVGIRWVYRTGMRHVKREPLSLILKRRSCGCKFWLISSSYCVCLHPDIVISRYWDRKPSNLDSTQFCTSKVFHLVLALDRNLGRRTKSGFWADKKNSKLDLRESEPTW